MKPLHDGGLAVGYLFTVAFSTRLDIHTILSLLRTPSRAYIDIAHHAHSSRPSTTDRVSDKLPAAMSSRSEKDVLASYSVSLAPSANGRGVIRYTQPEEPFFLLGDTAWELFHKLDIREAELYLRNRAEKGFNWVMAVILAENE